MCRFGFNEIKRLHHSSFLYLIAPHRIRRQSAYPMRKLRRRRTSSPSKSQSHRQNLWITCCNSWKTSLKERPFRPNHDRRVEGREEASWQSRVSTPAPTSPKIEF